MSPRPPALLCATALSVLVAGCATHGSLDARYDASLQHWKGATRAELVKSWGEPLLAAQAGDTETLTWVVGDDPTAGPPALKYASPAKGTPSVSVGSAASVLPTRCTTRFQLRRGVVEAWTFDGTGCGAPD